MGRPRKEDTPVLNAMDKCIGRKIRDARATKRMTQENLGKITGVAFQQIYKYENGDNSISACRLWVLAKSLEVPISYFFEDFEKDGKYTGY